MLTALAFLVLFGTFIIMTIGDIAMTAMSGIFTIIINLLTGRR